MRKIVVNVPEFDEMNVERLRKAAEENGFAIVFCDHTEDALREAAEAEIVYTMHPKVIAAAKQAKWVHLPSAGVAAQVNEELVPADVLLSNSTGAYGLTIGEHMVMFTLMLFRHMPELRLMKEEKSWNRAVAQRSIYGANFLLLGTGDIGKGFAKRLKGFEPAKIVGLSRSGKADPELFDEAGTLADLPKYLPEADVIALSMPSTPETYHVLNEETLALVKPGAIVINVGRGDAIDEKALIKALQDGRLLGAGLDVFEHEPLPDDDPLYSLDNVVFTPHVAGGFAVQYTRDQNALQFIEDLENYANGRPMKHLINRELGYTAASYAK